MKKYILIAMSVVTLSFTACSDDTMDKVNKDTHHPTAEIVAARLQMSYAIMNTAFSTVSGDYAFYTSSFTEQLIGTGNNQAMKAELRNPVEVAASTCFNNVWSDTYSNLKNLSEVIYKVENDVASSGGQLDVLGAAQVLWAINAGILTDMHGDIPYTEALMGSENMQPNIDSQQTVYADIISRLDKAIDNLSNATASNMGDQDLAFGGNINSWLATAYAVKARYLMHQSAVNNGVIAQAKAAAEKAVELGFDGFEVTEFNGINCDNPWSAYVWSRGYTAPSKHVADLMDANDDPRWEYYVGIDAQTPGDQAVAMESPWAYEYPMYYDLGSQPVHIMSAHELYFILAEAQLRLGEDATDAFQTAVALSVSEQASWLGYDEDGIEFAESLGTPDLQKLFDQKYIAMAVDEQVETYNDIRRLRAMGENYIPMTNPYNTQAGQNRWPELLPYGNSSVVSNPKLAAAYGDGYYIYTTKAWLFK